MSTAKMTKENNKIVLFLVLPNLVYRLRMGISLALILAAFLVQFQFNQAVAGFLLLACGNLLLLVKGYDNRVRFEGYHPEAEWTQVEMQTIMDLKNKEKSMKSWDLDLLDISNIAGGFIFVLAAAVMGLAYFVLLQKQGTESLQILIADAAVLLFPHWLTGLRRITNALTSVLTLKISVIENILKRSNRLLKKHKANYYMLLKGDKTKIPTDIKFRVDIANAPEDFLGLYGQVVLNNVQGKLYPYFYCVLVAKKGGPDISKLKDFKALNTPRPKQEIKGFFKRLRSAAKDKDKIITEYKLQKDVQVLVVRQFTTKTSGYHTEMEMEDRILSLSISMAETLAGF